MKRKFAVMLGILWFAAQAASAGLFYSARNTTEGVESSAADWQVDGWIDGDNAKIEFTSSGNPTLPAGAFLLTHDGGQNVYMVNPQEGTYSKWDIDAMLRMASDVLEATGGMLKVNIENPRVEILAEEPGGEVAGQATTYYRYRTQYDLEMKVMGMKRRQSTILDQEVWSADLDHPAFGVWLRKTPPSFGDSGIDDLIAMEAAKIKGFALKTVTETVVTGRKGKESRTRSVMEVTELRQESIADSVFALDSDLVETPMPMFDASQGEDDEAPGLRGLLKRRQRDG